MSDTYISYGQPSPFPPSFDGSPFAYGFGLFGDVVAAALSLAMLSAHILEARRYEAVHRLTQNRVTQDPQPKWSALHVYRLGNVAILSFVVLRALPDAIWMLAWGEVSETTIRILLEVDLILDGVALLPLALSVLCWTWGRQAIPQILSQVAMITVTGGPIKEIIFRNARIVLIVLVIAIGVTIGKASA
jgi:hypothetical protein